MHRRLLAIALMALALGARAQDAAPPAPLPELDYLKDGKVSIMQFSHQDLGWHAGSYVGEMRSVHRALHKALGLIAEHPGYIHDGELAVWLHEYVRVHPDKVDALKEQIQARRVQWGAGYTQPYTSLFTSEQVARLMYLGCRWFKQQFEADTTLWYNTDVPGMTAQMPQILAKAGVDKAYLCRSWNLDGIKTDFLNWYAPDGSGVFVFMMNHYGDYIDWKPGTPRIAHDPAKMTAWLAEQEPEYAKRKIVPVVPHLISKDNVEPRTDVLALIDTWNAYAADKDLPPMVYDSLSDMMDKVKASRKADFKTLAGDWPHRWVYEAAPAHYQMFMDNRNAARLITATEAFATFRAIVEGSWEHYPAARLMAAWKDVDFSCHGIAPDSSIETFRTTYARARSEGQAMLDEALAAIGARVKTRAVSADVTPFVVFNNLSWERTDVVELPIPEGRTQATILDANGKVVPSQVSDGRVVFVADAVPSLGYATFYLQPDGKPIAGAAVPGQPWSDPFENAFFTITPGKQGIASMVDKALKRELLRTDKFEAAQWLNFVYNGQGAGEHTHIAKPVRAALDQLGTFTTTWACRESGPVFTSFESKAVETPRGKVAFRVRLYAAHKRIDLRCMMRDCDEEASQQLRLTFPLNADLDHVAFEAPFGKVEVGKDEVQRHLAFCPKRTPEEIRAFDEQNKHTTPGWKKRMLRQSFLADTSVRPREIQNWIHAGDGMAGVTIGSSAIAWDYLDASAAPVDYPVLQPVMLCSAHSCNRWKDYFRQPGDHDFTFSIYSHAGDWRKGRRRGVATNNPLIPVPIAVNPRGTLPPRHAFLSVSAEPVVITAVKKAEDTDDVVIRCYEADGCAASRVTFTPDFRIQDARRTNLIEEDAGRMSHSSKHAELKIGPYAIETFRLVPRLN